MERDTSNREYCAILVKQVDTLISKNQALQILYLNHHDNAYKTSQIIVDKKLTKSTKI